MLKKIYSGKNSDSNFEGNGCLKCLINTILLAINMPH